jgi:hypothetical protein
MDPGRIVAIVKSAVADRVGPRDVSLASRVGDLLPTFDDRMWFRRTVWIRVKDAGVLVGLEEIPYEPHVTVRHVAETLIGALPGNPGLPDPDALGEGLPGNPGLPDPDAAGPEMPGCAGTHDPR